MATVQVLIVDDDESMLDVVSSFLKLDNAYTVHTVSNPREALEFAGNNSVDLLISDIMMPGMLGSTLLNEILQVSPKTRCIMISGYNEEIYNLPSEVLFLKKPFDLNLLLSTVKKALGESK